MSQAVIRRLTADDLRLWKQIREIALETDAAQFDETLEEFAQAPDSAHIDQLRSHLVVAAIADGVSVAVACAFPVQAERECNTIRLHGIFVAPEGRGKGLGRRVMEEAMRLSNADQAELLVRADNNPAIALYRRMGFVEAQAPCDAFCRTSGVAGDLYMLRRLTP